MKNDPIMQMLKKAVSKEDRAIVEKWEAKDFEFAEGLSKTKAKKLNHIQPYTDDWYKEVNNGNIIPF